VSVAVSAIAPAMVPAMVPSSGDVGANKELGRQEFGGGFIRRGMVATLPSSTSSGSNTVSQLEDRKWTRKPVSKPEWKKVCRCAGVSVGLVSDKYLGEICYLGRYLGYKSQHF